jgi:transcriptional regulator with XRE-family HTH domain
MALGMTQDELCERADVSRTYVQYIEAGKANPSIQTVERIRKALKCSWEDLLGKP